jgi:hypothetical protein
VCCPPQAFEDQVECILYWIIIQVLPRFLPIALELLKIRRLPPCGFSFDAVIIVPGSDRFRLPKSGCAANSGSAEAVPGRSAGGSILN